VRFFGGILYLTGMLVMAWNVFMTARAGQPFDAPIPSAVAQA
jgi:cytochrome c oxidase cbb3-type subunit 1